MSADPRERVVEVALGELLRSGAAPDYATRVRARWDAQRDQPDHVARGGRARRLPRAPEPSLLRRIGLPRLAAAAAGILGAAVAWRAWPDGAREVEPSAPTADVAAAPIRELAAGLEVLPAAFGQVVVNTTEAPLALALAGGERIELGPSAVLALERAPGTAGAPLRWPPRLLDGAADFRAPASSARAPATFAYGLGNVPADLVLTAGGRFRAELTRASGPHPLDAPDGAGGGAPGAFGRGQLLGPTWLTVEPVAGTLTWLDAAGRAKPQGEPFEAAVADAEGTLRPPSAEERALLDKLVAAVAPLPGIERSTEANRFFAWDWDSRERELLRRLEKEPALWVPTARQLERRMASHAEPYGWHGAHAVVALAESEAGLRVARRWWRDGAQRFDTDALLALAEAGHEPFVRELAALLAGELPRLDDVASRERLRRGGPDSDVALLSLAALARGDQRYAGRALDSTRALEAALRKGDLDEYGARGLLAAATLAATGLREPWDDAAQPLVELVVTLSEEGAEMPALMLAAHLDIAAESNGLAPYATANPAQALPRLAYFDRRVRERTLVLQGELPALADRPASLDAWLETWRER